MNKGKGCLVILILIILFFGGCTILASKIPSSPKSSTTNKESKVESSPSPLKSEVPVLETKNEQPKASNPIPKQKYALISGIDNDSKSKTYGELLVQEINVWDKAGSGGPNNVTVGRIPHNTKVKVLETKEVEGNTFYKILSSVGKVSVLPTDFNLRSKKMEELPESEWFVPADETFPVEGWVIDSFITKITEK